MGRGWPGQGSIHRFCSLQPLPWVLGKSATSACRISKGCIRPLVKYWHMLANNSNKSQPHSFNHPVSSSSVSPSLDIPPLEIGAKKCPVCLKEFRKFSKCKSHYDTQHSKQSLYTRKKCMKVLGSKANLQHHLELFHKHFNFVCIICQYSAQRKADISKHMKHNKDGLIILSCDADIVSKYYIIKMVSISI